MADPALPRQPLAVDLYFSNHFDLDPALLKEYGALDISVASDLPLFVDPFLLFNSENETYQEQHEEILRYLRFLRDEAGGNGLDPALIDDLYCFKRNSPLSQALKMDR